MAHQGEITVDITEDQITQAALNICRAHTGSDLQLVFVERILPDNWGRNLVWRYRVQDSPAGFPETLIVKCSNLGGGHIFSEWASLHSRRRLPQ